MEKKMLPINERKKKKEGSINGQDRTNKFWSETGRVN